MARMGRPRSFDRDQAIDKAMMLFWRHGFDATSLNQLKAELNISSASFYAAFQSKELLFREAVSRYLSGYGDVSNSLWDTSLPALEALEKTIRDSARMQTDVSHPAGCMLVVTAMASSVESEHLKELLRLARDRIRSGIEACLLRAREAREIDQSADVSTLSAVFETFLFGLSTEARDGVSIDRLDGSITQMMSLLKGPRAS